MRDTRASAPSTVPALRLLLRGIGAGILAAHVAGALLFALVVVVEAADEPLSTLLATVVARVPELWAGSAAVLGMVGAAAACFRMRRRGVVLGLGTLGVSPAAFVVVAAVLGALGGVAAGAVAEAPRPDPTAWVRGEGGWIRGGLGWPDEPGAAVYERRAPGRAWGVELANAAAGGACGAALGLWAAAAPTLVLAAVLLVLQVVARGLVDRAVFPAAVAALPALFGVGILAVLAFRAPLFPRRWG